MDITSGGLLAGIYGIQALSAWSTSNYQADAIKAQGDYVKMRDDGNARLSMLSAEDAIKRGDLAAGAVQRKASAVKGAQKVNAAAQGVDIGTGSAGDLQAETDQMSEIDKMNVKNNAWREAWGYKVQADNFTGQGNMAQIGAQMNARQTVLTGGLQALGYAGMAGYSYLKNRELTDLAKGDPKNPANAKPTSGGPNRSPSSVDIEADQATRADAKKSQDVTAGDLKKSIGYDWRQKEYGSDYENQMYGPDWKQNMSDHYATKSKDNPLYPGRTLTNSWWIKYDDTGDF